MEHPVALDDHFGILEHQVAVSERPEDDDHAATILRNCVRSLRAGGKVVLIDAVVPEYGSQPLPSCWTCTCMPSGAAVNGRWTSSGIFSAGPASASIASSKRDRMPNSWRRV